VQINEQCLGPVLVLVEVVDSSTIRIKFSLDISESLSASDVQAFLGGLNVQFSLVQNADSTYTLTFPEGTDLDKLQLFVGQLEVLLHLDTKGTSSSDFSPPTSAIVNALLLTGFVTGMFSGSWSLLWSFFNTLELISYIPMKNIPLPSFLSYFLVNLINFAVIPSAFSYIHDGSPAPPSNVQRLQINSTTFLANVEYSVKVFVATLLSGGFAFLFSFCSIPLIKETCEKYLQNFKCNFFIRFILEAFMEFTFCSLLQLIYWSTESKYLTFNSVFAVFIIVNSFVVTIFILWLITKNSDKLHDHDFLKKFGSAYDEFKNDRGVFSSLFYFFYCVRRLIYSFILFFLEAYPAAQVTINSSMSVLVVVYIAYYQAYTPRRYFVYNLYLEAVTAVVFIVTGFWLLDLSQFISDALMYGLIALVTSVGVLSLIIFIYDFVTFLKSARRKEEIKKRTII
jgi:hypothetical protein